MASNDTDRAARRVPLLSSIPDDIHRRAYELLVEQRHKHEVKNVGPGSHCLYSDDELLMFLLCKQLMENRP